MELDVKTRQLPKGYLVNKEGHAAKKGDTGIFYCGRRCMFGVAFCDGYCGPKNGPACPSCRILNDQSRTRYR